MSRRLARLVAVAAMVALCSIFATATAAAQPGHEGHAHAQPTAAQPTAAQPTAQPGHEGHAHTLEAQAAAAESGADHAEADAEAGTGHVTALFFWLFAFGTLGGAVFVITRRNLVAAVVGMVGTFFALAGLFLMLYAGFLAAIQVLVYAGAIMVLFVFVIMILNREEDDPWAIEGLLGKGLAGIALLYMLVRLGKILWAVKDARPVLPAPAPTIQTVIENGQPVQRIYEFGSVRGVGHTLFTDYLFPFEAVSLVLLVAVVGAIAIARPKPVDEAGIETEAETP